MQAAVRLALLSREHRPHDAEIVASLIDLDKIEIDERGNIKRGLDKQLEALEEKRPFLLNQGAKTPTGAKPFAPNPAAKKCEDKPQKSIGKELAHRDSCEDQSKGHHKERRLSHDQNRGRVKGGKKGQHYLFPHFATHIKKNSFFTVTKANSLA